MGEGKEMGKGNIEMKGIVWMIAWLCLNVLCTLMNKALFQFADFHFPITLSSIHMFYSFMGSYFMLRYEKIERVEVSTTAGIAVIFSLSVVFCLNITVSNISLRLITISLSQVIRSTIPAFAMCLSFFLLTKTYTKLQIATVCIVCMGVAMATMGELDFNILGTSFAFLGCFLSALKAVQSNMMLGGSPRLFLQSDGKDAKFHPYDLLNWLSFFSFWEMLLLANIDGELSQLGDWSDGLIFDFTFLLLLSANGLVAFLLNVANFNFINHTSALTVTICGNVKCVLTILISVIIFQNPISKLNFMGTVLTILGASIYSYLAYTINQSPSLKKETV